MQKYFTSILTDKKGYGLSQSNVEVWMKDKIMSRVRLEECERNIMFMQSKARLEIF